MTPSSLASKPSGASLELAPGSVLAGKYTLVRPIGVGGMGAVWLACNEATGAEVALKVLLPRTLPSTTPSFTLHDCAELSARFRREAYTTARLCHRGIVRIYDLVEIEGNVESSLVLVMELLRGHTLAAYLHQRGRLPLDEALGIILPVLSALAYAHQAGIVHRDLKPENIFLAIDPDGVMAPKILDFGISKVSLPKAPIITRVGEMLGTPSYMSPEQIRGKDVGAESDIFNVGILLYEMLSGQNPFAGEGLHSMVVATLESYPAPIAGITPELWSVIDRALSKSPRERYASAKELAVALRLAVGLPLTASIIPGNVASDRECGEAPFGSLPWALTGAKPSVRDVAKTRARARTIGAAAVAVAIASAASVSLAWGSRAHTAPVPPSAEEPYPAFGLEPAPTERQPEHASVAGATLPTERAGARTDALPRVRGVTGGAVIPAPPAAAGKAAPPAPVAPRPGAAGKGRGGKVPLGIARDPGF